MKTLTLLCAFRYALGRKSYITSHMAEEIIYYWNVLEDTDKKLIQREIKEAIEQGKAGMDCDIAQWERVLQVTAGDKKNKESV